METLKRIAYYAVIIIAPAVVLAVLAWATMAKAQPVPNQCTQGGNCKVASLLATKPNGAIEIRGAAGTNRAINFSTGTGSTRWIFRTTSSSESGSNAGSNIEFSARTDAGALLSTPLQITRSSGVVLIDKIQVGSGTTILKHISASKTWDPDSVNNDAMTSTTVTVTGCAVGDTVAVGFSTAVVAGGLLVGAVTATNTCTVTYLNETGGTIDMASGTLRCDCWQH